MISFYSIFFPKCIIRLNATFNKNKLLLAFTTLNNKFFVIYLLINSIMLVYFVKIILNGDDSNGF